MTRTGWTPARPFPMSHPLAPGDPSRNQTVWTYRLRLLLFLSALLTGLTGLLPGVGVANAQQVAQAQVLAGQIAVAVIEADSAATARPEQAFLRDPQPLFLTPEFTYFQQMGGFDCKPVAGELTYGLERLAMYIQDKDSVYDLAFNDAGVTYGDVFLENEKQMSKWNFEVADTDGLFDLFKKAAAECENALAHDVPIAAYEQAIEASHVFNLLNARGVISVAERQAYIGRVRDLAKGACAKWIETQTPKWQATFPGWVA